MSRDLGKKDLYEGVKLLIDAKSDHLQLNQAKLFTLVSIGFQYFLFQSTKNPGAYILRVEDSQLAHKISRKAKDPSTRKFFQSLFTPRKLKYQKSMFYLDFFNISSWNITKDLETERIKGALVIQNTNPDPFKDMPSHEDDEAPGELPDLPDDYFYSALQGIADKTIFVSFREEIEGLKKVKFPFIKEDLETELDGVKINTSLKFEREK